MPNGGGRRLVWGALGLCIAILAAANIFDCSQQVGAACTVIGAAALSVALCAQAVTNADLRAETKLTEAIGVSLASAGVLLTSGASLEPIGAGISAAAVVALLFIFAPKLGKSPSS